MINYFKPRQAMNKFLFILFFILLIAVSTFSLNHFDTATTLVVLEEKENGDFPVEFTPFSDGVFSALWDKECMFFDMKISKPLNFVSNMLDVKPFLNEARGSGADSLLLIKFDYKTVLEKTGIKISVDEIAYNFYSLDAMKSIKSVKKSIAYNKFVETEDEKIKEIKNFGYSLLNEIYGN
jgi:hypothetical protein